MPMSECQFATPLPAPTEQDIAQPLMLMDDAPSLRSESITLALPGWVAGQQPTTLRKDSSQRPHTTPSHTWG